MRMPGERSPSRISLQKRLKKIPSFTSAVRGNAACDERCRPPIRRDRRPEQYSREEIAMRLPNSLLATRGVGTVLALVLAVATVFQGPALAQTETGQIAGTVSDPQGAVVTGATVTVTSKDTGA